MTVHHFKEQIAGRTYLIEVRPVAEERWRAQIECQPGVTTALMPFYGTTPELAVRELSRWLALLYNNTKQ